MSATTTNRSITMIRLLSLAAALLIAGGARAAAPGITGPAFNLTAQPSYLTQPDGQSIYSWGYGCNGAPSGFAPSAITGAFCSTMQVPGPTLIVTEGQTVSVTLTNNLPAAAGNTSILFPGFQVTAAPAGSQPATCTGAPMVQGLLTSEATNGCAVTYTFVAGSPGTRAYYSGTQGDLQVEMGLYGAVIVLPATIPTACTSGLHAANLAVEGHWGESDFRLAAAAYDHAKSCYDREYLFQFSEIDPNIHTQAEAQVNALSGCIAGAPGCSLAVPTEPYHPAYFLINGRSMPDDMDPNYAAQYPHQPYNGNPHMHPGEEVLLRIVGQGRWQHPFHEHANHVRILARDGNLILSQTDANSLAGPLLFTTTTTPGLAMDGIFHWTGKGLNWDPYGHHPGSSDPNASLPCVPDANGYNTGVAAQSQINYFEWCQDHNKPVQVAPFGDVAAGGPTTLPDPNLFTTGAWYGGSPYLGPDATTRAVGPTGVTPPSGTIANPPTTEAGFAYMWHSHNEREITTNNAFPGGMMMMMLVDSREFVIDESN
ncbi:MAG TPA: multicopper oxidase family protein [Rhodocyclaceae bacterium]|nr:multicopper oxidase family protein [Rhodocyclaceae bacterium]